MTSILLRKTGAIGGVGVRGMAMNADWRVVRDAGCLISGRLPDALMSCSSG